MNFEIFRNTFILEERNNIYRFIIIGLNVLSIICIFYRYNLSLNNHKLSSGSIAKYGKIYYNTFLDNFCNSGLISPLILEIFINIIFIPPYLTEFTDFPGSIQVNYNFGILLNNATFKNPITTIKCNIYI